MKKTKKQELEAWRENYKKRKEARIRKFRFVLFGHRLTIEIYKIPRWER